MKKNIVIFILIIITTIAVMIALQHKNPILKYKHDYFAKIVNDFQKRDIGNLFVNNCGDYYAYPEQLEESSYYTPEVKMQIGKQCAADMKRLLLYLNTIPDFKSVTFDDLVQPATWKYYFKSKRATK